MKTNKLLFLLLLICWIQGSSMVWKPQEWPVLKKYDQEHLYQIALPLGGIGTGTVSLGGRGELRDWEIMNVPGKKYSTVTIGNNAPFFAIYTRMQDGTSQTRLLEGPLYAYEYQHYEGRPVNHHGLPRFKDCSFDAAYPFGQVNLSDDSLPIKVTIKGFNPLIPCDAESSGIPIAVLCYEVKNLSESPIEVSVCGSIRNFVGKDGSKFVTDWKGDYIPVGCAENKNMYKSEAGLNGIYFYSEGVEKTDPAYGNMSLVTDSSGFVTYRTSSKADNWSNGILNFWDDFSTDGELDEMSEQYDDDPMASLSVKKLLSPGKTEYFTFYLTWNFPNRKAWSSTVIGNYYSLKYPDSWETAKKIVPKMSELESKSLDFVNSLLSCSYPDVVKEAALFNLSTLRSQTVFRIPSGHLMGWEGIMDRFGSCKGTCTHVWNYEQATSFLFGELAMTMRDVEFNYATKENGLMNFRAALPLSEASKGNAAAADGQMGCVMKFYRDWQLSGDNNFLYKNWDNVKKVLSYAWIERGWDGNQDGVMEGSQHNTMDVSYFGPNPQMSFWYLGALKAAGEMAHIMKDKAFENKCKHLFENGARWVDDNLFNGEYYEHKITEPKTFRFLDVDKEGTKIPAFQLGRGCLVDQLVGQYMSHICGLGYLANRNNIRKTMESIMKYNYVEDFSSHFNNMRSFVFGNESGLLMASWPKGRLEVPFPYFSEVMTGFEYCAAVGMIYEGMEKEGLKCIKAIRDRYDGVKRNPFSEAECGYHYARAMASWSALIALSGFQYSGVENTMHITSTPGTYFWSNGYSWGICNVGIDNVEIKVSKGSLKLKSLYVGNKKIKFRNFNLLESNSKIVVFRN